MEGRVCFEYLWGLKPVLVYALCHTKPIFDFDYHNKPSNTPNNMSSRKCSNTYWSTNTFAPSVAICIARIICHRLSAAICIGRPICLCSSAAICIDRSICHRWRTAICIGQPICHPESAAICIDYTNMTPSSIRFTKHIEIHIVLSKVCWLVRGRKSPCAESRCLPSHQSTHPPCMQCCGKSCQIELTRTQNSKLAQRYARNPD